MDNAQCGYVKSARTEESLYQSVYVWILLKGVIKPDGIVDTPFASFSPSQGCPFLETAGVFLYVPKPLCPVERLLWRDSVWRRNHRHSPSGLIVAHA